VLPASEFQADGWATLADTCPTTDHGRPEGFPAASVLLSYRLVNLGQVNLTGVQPQRPAEPPQGSAPRADQDHQSKPESKPWQT
jgi:hypothetical protein